MITEEAAEKALNYLKSTDDDAARLKSRYEWMKEKSKTVLAIYYNEIESGSQGDRDKKSLSDPRYIEHLQQVKEAHEEWLIMMNKRKSAELQIEMWRSMNANMRRGNI